MAETQGIVFDKKDQLAKVQSGLLEGEKLHAVFDMKGGGTGFLGITSFRLMFMDKSFIGKKSTTISLPYSRITMVGAEDKGGAIFKTSVLTVATSGITPWQFEFRSGDKTRYAHQLILQYLLRT